MSRYDLDDFPPRVKHIPLKPARPGTPGEGIFLRMWQRWAEATPHEWQAIFVTTHRPRQRAASVAASFMVFMGCNGGAGFTHMAEQFARDRVGHSRETSFRAAWSVYNARQTGINSGLRTAEYMLAAEHPIEGGVGGGRLNWKKVPDITQDDNDYLESMVVWWSGEEAGAMRKAAEPLIRIANDMQWHGIHADGPTHPHPEINRVKRTLQRFAEAA